MFLHRAAIERRAERGFTFAELAFAFVIMVTVSLALLSHVSSVYQRNANHKDRVFAYAKAQSLLAELQSYVNRSEDTVAGSLDAFDDGSGYEPTLTILKENDALVAPDHPMSGNRRGIDGWAWARRITVRQFPGLQNRNVRYVTVRIFRSRGAGKWEQQADLSGVVNSIGSAFPPTQEFDVFVLAIENIPGWWVHMDAMRPFVESTITDLEARNPGVKLRTHWITKAAYGRNQLYAPATNLAVDSTQPIPGVYTYPGTMPSGSSSSFYYVPSLIRGRLLVDGVPANGYESASNPHPYALADNYNHAMRLPDERALFARRLAAGLEKADEPTLRLLLEDMAADPARYHNAILVNLHGELLPMPALRNFSDAAKSPSGATGLRTVTHGERLRFRRGATATDSDDVVLRVHAWRTNPSSPADNFTAGQPITLQIVGVDLTRNVNGAGSGPLTLEVQRLEGGVDRGDGDRTYRSFAAAPRTATLPREMWFRASFVDQTQQGGEKYTLLELHNTPSVAPLVGSSPNDRGLPATRRLYGLDYIPCSTEATNDFSTTLATAGVRPKNTARWRIRLPRAVLDGDSTGSGLTVADHLLTVRTRIGSDLTTGSAYPTPHDPENLSTTYVWWTDSVDDVPFTERYQFLGDPRHCPYADLKENGASFPNGYNWFFDDLVDGSTNARSDWPGFSATSRLRDRWLGRLEVDYPRYAQLLRTALTRSEAVYTTLTGFSYFYLGLGQEIGSDASNGYPMSLPMSRTPFGGTGWGYADNISGGGDSNLRWQSLVREAASANYWWGIYWIGELYPDNRHQFWTQVGNLPAGGATGQFHRVPRESVTLNLPRGTRLVNANRTTQREGCTSFFNVGTSSATFHHGFADGQYGRLEGAGNELASRYNFPLPTSTRISRPFGIDLSGSGGVGDEWSFTGDYPRYRATVDKLYYLHTNGDLGSALIGLTDPSGLDTARIVVNGLDRTTESGTSFIAKYAVLSLIHSYFEAGNPSFANRIKLPPRVELVAPTEITELDDPVSIAVTWNVSWRRWDGGKYSYSFDDAYTQSEAELEYVLSYSADGGKTFRYLQDGSLAKPGVRPDSPAHLVPDAGTGNETLPWQTPSDTFPAGTYILRVEAYRTNEALHYAHHQSKIYIQR